MMGISLHPLAWLGLGVGFLLLLVCLELLLQWLAVRFGTPQLGYRGRGAR